MIRKVFIFGGYKTRIDHYKYALSVYDNNPEPYFYKLYTPLHAPSPKTIINNVTKALTNIEEHDNIVIHCNSSGFWSALVFNKMLPINIKRKLIFESCPLEASYDAWYDTIINATGFRLSKKILKKGNPIWIKAQLEPFWEPYIKELINYKCLVIVSKNDEVVNFDHIGNFCVKTNASLTIFNKGNHCNIQKANGQEYLDTIRSFISS